MLLSLRGLFGVISLFAICNLKAAASPTLPPDVYRDIVECMDACKPFKANLYQFSQHVDEEHWQKAKKSFSTCQWKCYRCSLQPAVAGMDGIESAFRFLHGDSRPYKQLRYNIYEAISNCRERWTVADMLGCSKDPVEKVEMSCKS